MTRFENGRLGDDGRHPRPGAPAAREAGPATSTSTRCRTSGARRTFADVTGYCVARTPSTCRRRSTSWTSPAATTASKILASSGAVVPANLAALHSPQFLDPSRFPRDSVVFDARDPARRPDAQRAGLAGRGQPDPAVLDRMFYSPVLDLDSLLPRIDEVSSGLLAPPTPSASPQLLRGLGRQDRVRRAGRGSARPATAGPRGSASRAATASPMSSPSATTGGSHITRRT